MIFYSGRGRTCGTVKSRSNVWYAAAASSGSPADTLCGVRRCGFISGVANYAAGFGTGIGIVFLKGFVLKDLGFGVEGLLFVKS